MQVQNDLDKAKMNSVEGDIEQDSAWPNTKEVNIIRRNETCKYQNKHLKSFKRQDDPFSSAVHGM